MRKRRFSVKYLSHVSLPMVLLAFVFFGFRAEESRALTWNFYSQMNFGTVAMISGDGAVKVNSGGGYTVTNLNLLDGTPQPATWSIGHGTDFEDLCIDITGMVLSPGLTMDQWWVTYNGFSGTGENICLNGATFRGTKTLSLGGRMVVREDTVVEGSNLGYNFHVNIYTSSCSC